ncbi:MAG: pentapeptide repeat-containing protein, partial [Bacteroidota bacterium]
APLLPLSTDDNYLIALQKYFKAAERGNRKFLKGHLDCLKFLTSADLRNLNLQGINFSQATLPKDLSSTNLTKAKLPQDLSKHNLTHANLSKTDLTNVKLPHDLSSVNFTDAKLPKDLSNHNLNHANLTGHDFMATNFEGTQLEDAILTKTTCDYQQCFQDHIKANKLSGGSWYSENLLKDLKSIAQIYPHFSQNTHKAALLQIASGLAYLPYWEGKEFYIKVYYWSCKLFLLKKQLSSGLGEQLVCSLGNYSYGLNYEAKNYCWQTDYPQNQVEETKEAPHDKFEEYLKTFQAGLQKYNCQSEYSWGYDWYKDNIEKNIQGLQKTYPRLTIPKLQKEAIDIAFQLSTLYQNQHWHLLFRYLFFQNRLIRFKISAGIEVANKVYYNHHKPLPAAMLE